MLNLLKSIGKEILFLLAAIVSFTVGYLAGNILSGFLSLMAFSLIGKFIGKKLAESQVNSTQA
ncbi:hypothetical protein [Kangiella marina]|uniref:Uncharacterized protein n=1 Tax=Kangiella marina TaxID=1079178 RepID=A0ABP8IIP1_9GAMM